MNKCKLLGLSLLLASTFVSATFAAAEGGSHYTTGRSLKDFQTQLKGEKVLLGKTPEAEKEASRESEYARVRADQRRHLEQYGGAFSTQVRSSEQEKKDNASIIDRFLKKELSVTR